MYQIYADDTLIYDSGLDDYRIGKGKLTREVDKSGSLVFSLYPEHFFYSRIVRMRTVIKVLKDGRVVFRGRVLDDVVDYWNQKTCTCEGELGFLQDSIVRPYDFAGTPEELFRKVVTEHNAQVDEFKRFKIGTCTVIDANGYIARDNTAYESALSNLQTRLLDSTTSGHLYITHDEDDDLPTLHYLADYPNTASQAIEFGVNLTSYTQKVNAADICTAVIPLGADVGEGDDAVPLTIASVNDGKDYVFSEAGVTRYGWIFKTVEWEDVTDASNLLKKAQAYVDAAAASVITLELTAVDLHLLDRSIESYSVGDYVHISSPPHRFDAILLCTKQTLDLLSPANDTVILGHTYASFTATAGKGGATINPTVVQAVQHKVDVVTGQLASHTSDIEAILARLEQIEQGAK